MNGIGLSEMLVIGLLVLIFFGSKELPRMMREMGKLIGNLRQYSDKLKRELDEAGRALDPTAQPARHDAEAERKGRMRKQLMAARKAVSPGEREALSGRIAGHVLALPEIADARAVMVYLDMGSEVATGKLIEALKAAGKRIVVPYCRDSSRDLGIAEVSDVATHTGPGEHGCREPLAPLRGNFLKSDIGAIVCPGVGFDRHGGRLGRGKGYYDNFLRELQNRIQFIGLAFQCQVSEEFFPFTYHDVPMTQVVTENGPLIAKVTSHPSQGNTPAAPGA